MKTDGRLYRIGDDHNRIYYKRQGLKGIAYLRRALYEHECWQHGNEPTDTLPLPIEHPAYDDFGSEIPTVATVGEPGNLASIQYVSQQDLDNYFRDELSNPITRADFAARVGIPELVNLHSLPPLTSPLLLSDVLSNYIDGKIFKHNRQYADATTAWSLFASAVAVSTIEDIDSPGLQRFHKAIRKFSVRTQGNYINQVQSILKYAADIFKLHRLTIGNLKVDVRRICFTANGRDHQPKPMKVSEYLALLSAFEANGQKMWTSMLLASLNFAYHPGEAAAAKLSEYDFDAMELRSHRPKDGITRVGVIWPRTAEAIQAYMDSDEYRGKELLFTLSNGSPLQTSHINTVLRRVRRACGLPETVKFDGIRDLTRTKAGAENVVAIKWIMGHSMGQDDAYAFREARETRKALAKVERAVFGGKERKR